MDSKDKFTRKAENYLKHRPLYPDAFIEYLKREVGLSKDSVVADIGAGTGILTKRLAGMVKTIYAVEPNISMRTACEQYCIGKENIIIIDGSAEDTALPNSLIDFVTVAQAFHWFNLEKFKLECQRILRPSGKAILVWNCKLSEDPITKERERICKKYCPDFKGFAGGQGTAGLGYSDKEPEKPKNCISFFRHGNFEFREFENNLSEGMDNFIGGVLSSSYALNKEDENFIHFIGELTELFKKFNVNGVLVTPNVTRSYVGEV